MKKSVFSMVFASALLGATSIAFAGAYGEAEQPEEIPAPAPAAPAPEPVVAARTMREYDGFLTDPETTRGFRVEAGADYAAEYHPRQDSDGANAYLHMAYGTELFEVGALLPYRYGHIENLPGPSSIHGVDDLRVWGKIMPLRTEHGDLGGGLVVRFPTANSGVGTSEYGFEPFLAGSTPVGAGDLRLTVGYNVTTDPQSPRIPADDTYDYSDMNLALLWPVSDRIVVRGELTHQHLMANDADPVRFLPGVDVSFPIGELELLLRPTFGVGITEAPDWQLGMGIALNVPGI